MKLHRGNEINYLEESESRKLEAKATISNTLTLPRQRRQKDGELQYCSNNATTPEASCLSFYQPGCSYKLGSDGAICTSTRSCRSCHLVSWHKSVRAQANFYRLTEEALSMMDES